MLKAVLDTDVLVAAFGSATGASRLLLLRALDGVFQPLASTTLLLEYEAVLTRPVSLARAGLTATEVGEALDEFLSVCEVVSFDYRWRPMARDPDDDFVLETAINGGAGAIASFNLTDLTVGAARFGIPVLRPAALLRRITQ